MPALYIDPRWCIVPKNRTNNVQLSMWDWKSISNILEKIIWRLKQQIKLQYLQKKKNFLSVNIHSYNIQRCETQPSLNAWQGKAEERRYREQPWDHYYSKKITMIKFHCHQSKIPYAILEGQRQSQSQIQSLY